MPYKVIGGKPTEIQYSADEVFTMIKRDEIKFIDLQFTSLPGRFHHTTISSITFTSDQMQDGLPKLDGSSIVGFTTIDDSDLILKPDPSTFAVIPWMGDQKSARMLCDIYRGAGKGRLETDLASSLLKLRLEKASLDSSNSSTLLDVEKYILDSQKEMEERKEMILSRILNGKPELLGSHDQ